MFENYNHTTVLQIETVRAILPTFEKMLQSKENNSELVMVDCTLGGGGHAVTLMSEFLSQKELSGFALTVYGVDRDPAAIKVASARVATVAQSNPRVKFVPLQMNFAEAARYLIKNVGEHRVDGLYADFGVSSPQLDQGERGFSFMKEGPLDMRMDTTSGHTAAELLSSASEDELKRIFFEYGEEPKGRKLASVIVNDRAKGLLPLNSTTEFANYVAKHLGYSKSRVHPATRVFQALRIAVNDELGSIEALLEIVPFLMSDFAKAGFISFHSLEDRIVKNAMRFWESEAKDELTGAFPVNPRGDEKRRWGSERPRGGLVPGEEEVARNPRARSARLRVFEFTEGRFRSRRTV